jgi:2-haloacid dehalogenase
VAELNPRVARSGRLDEAGCERRRAAEFRQVVIASSDRAKAEPHHLLRRSRREAREAAHCDGEASPVIVRRPLGNREEAMAGTGREIVIFDLGGVLIEWDPRHLYRKLFAGDDAAMEHFLATVCTHEWNRAQDAGRSFAEGARLLKTRHPDKAKLIDAYGARFDEMIPGSIAGSVAILAELRERGTPLYALTNFSAETYPRIVSRFGFLTWFRGVVVSGEVGAIKPNREIFHALLETYAIDPRRAVFIDDVPVNAAAAAALGIHGIHFTTPELLRAELAALGLLS